jgi:hypothetical protein
MVTREKKERKAKQAQPRPYEAASLQLNDASKDVEEDNRKYRTMDMGSSSGPHESRGILRSTNTIAIKADGIPSSSQGHPSTAGGGVALPQ